MSPEAMLDTGVWIAVLEGEPMADLLPAAQGERETLTSPVVLAELASLTKRGRVSKGSPVDAVLRVARVEGLTVEDAVQAGELHGKLRASGHEKVGLGDCLIYASARRAGALLITTDADLAGQPGVTVLGAGRSRRGR